MSGRLLRVGAQAIGSYRLRLARKMNTTTDKPQGPLAAIVALAESARPTHWVKNAFVLAPLLFANQFREPMAVAREVMAMVAPSAAPPEAPTRRKRKKAVRKRSPPGSRWPR